MKGIPPASAAWALFAVALIGNAGHWFITPVRHPNAPTSAILLHATQALAGVLVGVYAQRLASRERAAELEDADVARGAERMLESPTDGQR